MDKIHAQCQTHAHLAPKHPLRSQGTSGTLLHPLRSQDEDGALLRLLRPQKKDNALCIPFAASVP
jgi:hypothetical protein